MEGKVTKNIMEYMNSFSRKQFSYKQVSVIASSIKTEFYDRKEKGLIINGKTKKGKDELNIRVSKFANIKLGKDIISPEDVRLYKRCFAEEYSMRTGKCAWGFKEIRERYGYDVNTGKELAL